MLDEAMAEKIFNRENNDILWSVKTNDIINLVTNLQISLNRLHRSWI